MSETLKRFVAIVVLAVFALPASFGAPRGVRPVWPKKRGVYVAPSSPAIPLFPRAVSEYRATGGNDYWGRPFVTTGSLRIFEGNGWVGITDFPMTMNHCSEGIFMIRWRSANPDVRNASALGYHYSNVIYAEETGTFGYMQGTNCEEPLFRFVSSPNRNKSTLVDIYYELKFWQAAP